jgi:hypothetical protein
MKPLRLEESNHAAMSSAGPDPNSNRPNTWGAGRGEEENTSFSNDNSFIKGDL